MTYTKRAYQDIKASPNWFATLLLAALVNLVPILNWNNSGFYLLWARDARSSAGAPLPSYRIDGETFKAGFFTFVIGLAVAIALCVASFILGIIPILGALAAVVAAVFVGVFSMLMCIRYGITQDLGRAFDLKCIWNALRDDFIGALEATYLPMLVILVAQIVVSVIYGLAVVVLAGGAALAAAAASPLAGIAVLGPAGIILTIVFAFVMSVLAAMAMALAFRAIGYWAADHSAIWQ